ncbi:MAG: hypothetical protein EZS28_022842 [Streblomastix strix]|uniref:Uncharacterized protein n=1 Tax=Streblomastix strix TaxID=222440 RepID=A0A5J4VGD6_9EUKA|nr:MAG: hypothetical protein EZS28_022842 [Streblomastix strix]
MIQKVKILGDLEHLICYIIDDTTPIQGNAQFQCGQRISIEVNMTSNPRRAVFFIDGVEQKNSIANIPEAIRFYVNISKPNSSFQITKFGRLQSSSARGGPGSKSWVWGKDWAQ